MTDYISREAAKEKCCFLCRWEGTANCEECEHPIAEKVKRCETRDDLEMKEVNQRDMAYLESLND